MKWFNEILTAAKSFFGMEHDATEQEVHEKLTSMKSINDMRAAIQAEEAQRYGAQIQAEADRATAAEQRAQELEEKLTAANAALDGLQSNINQLKADAESLRARITELEKMPAADHTDGQTGTTPATDAAEKPYLNDPITQKAMKIRANLTTYK